MSHTDNTGSPWLDRCTRLELAVGAHVGLMVLFSSWAYGGNIWWARDWLTVWGLGGGVILCGLALAARGEAGREARRQGWVLAPWAVFCLLTLAACLNPSFRAVMIEGDTRLLHEGDENRWLPSTTNPATTLKELAFYAGAWLAACNLWLVVRSRQLLRWIFASAAISAFILAVFGTLQKLLVPSNVLTAGPKIGYFTGYYFGAELSPQKRFFSTFIYNNHWGAFMVLWLSVAVGLLFHVARRAWTRRLALRQTPFFALLAVVLFMAMSAPVSASRSATLLAGTLGMLALGVVLWTVAVERRRCGRAAWPLVGSILGVALLFVLTAGWFAQDSIAARTKDTRELLVGNGSLVSDRLDLYRDTWRLASEKPLFGWGLGSYGTALQLLRPRPVALNRQYERSYVSAHSDWLESLAENGFIGTVLVVCMAVVPIALRPRGRWRHPLTAWPLVGCALVAAYAWVEFPFGNGAVVITFWTVFFAALRHAELQRRATQF